MTNGVPTYEELLQENQSLKTKLNQLEEHGSDRQLSKQEQFYRLLARVSFDYVFVSKVISDNNLDLEWVIGAFETITGFTLEEYKAAGGWRGRIHPDDLAVDDHDFKELLANRSVNTEIRTIRKDGSCLWVQVYAQPVWNQKDDRMEGIFGAVQDITVRKKAELALMESEEKYRTLVESASDSILIIQEGKVVFANHIPYKISGYAPEEIIGAPFINFIDPEDREIVGTLYEKRQRGEDVPFSYETRIVLRNGELRPAEISITHFTYHEKPAELVFIRDIAERKQLEASRDQERSLLKALINNLPVSVFVKDRKLRKTAVNTAHLKRMALTLDRPGLREEDVLGRTDFDLYPGELAQVYYQEDKRVIEEGETIHEREDQSVDRQGNPVWELISKFPLRDPDGKIVGMIGIAYEITELKKALEAITLMNQNLEQHVAERTAELEAANKDLEAFAYSVSHDLRAPLRHIDGFSRILQRNLTNPSAEVLRDLGKICDSTTKMGSMIDALLKFSRLGRKALSKTEVNLNLVVRQVINQFRPAIEHRNIRFVTTELPTVMGDHALLLIVFENLISNAVKFTAGKEEAVIEIGQETGGDAKPVIFVKDNGVGFDMIYADKLFNVFQRLHTDEEFEGTGVGLANVKRIIQKHGGTIRAAAGVNQGAAFYLTL
ncbi:MAG: PAS domain S-box protein [Alphaproteobacteria bacterium]|nr:PAS domain S-box protein [Alphaproteobacteria bacterium]